MNGHIVIVGAGQAGVAAAFKLRALKYDGNITLLGEEPGVPYHRPPLSKKYLNGAVEAERLHIKNRSLYDSEKIRLRCGSSVTALNRREKNIVLDDGTVLEYDHLILATGARPRRLPAALGGDAPNVHTFRTLADAERLRQDMLPGKHLLVIGGGYIGLETAAVARSMGVRVTIIERDSRILGRVASAETAAYFKALHAENDVLIHEDAALIAVEFGDKRVRRARLADGRTIDTDLVVTGIGVVPETHLAEQAGLMVDGGIVVDAAGRTSDPCIYAAGDCARFPYQGERVLLESVQNAVSMAETVARAIVGEAVEYQPIPWFWSDQYATKLQIAGLNRGYTHVAVRQVSASVLSIWYYKGPRFIAVDAINDAKAFMTAKQWLSAGRSPVAAEISDPGRALGEVSLSASIPGEDALMNRMGVSV